MNWLPTSPFGPHLSSWWICEECLAAAEYDATADPDEIRAEATAHLRATGHRVVVSRGTVETLYPMATDPEGGEPS